MRRVLLFPLILAVVLAVGCSDQMPTETATDYDARPVVTKEGGIDFVANGVGLFDSQPQSFDLTVPVADAGDILQAWFYWSGRSFDNVSDPTIMINGDEYVGTLMANYQVSSDLLWAFYYKMDGMALVQPGLNSFEVEGFNLGEPYLMNGIGLVVIYADDSSDCEEVMIVEPFEFVYHADPIHTEGTVWSFAFDPTDMDREGKWVMFVGDAEPVRTDRIWYDSGPGAPPANLIGGPYAHLDNMLESNHGPQYDVVTMAPITIPANAEYFAYQLESPTEGNGDSMMNSFSVFCVATPEIPEAACCLPDGACVVLTEEECLARDGDWYADLPDCDPDPCAPPPDGCWRTIGFWKHQFNCALGELENANQHVSDEQLTELLAIVAAFTTIPDYTGADDVISFEEADSFLDLHGSSTWCERALQQHLANLLNFAVNSLNGSIMVDTDYDDVPDMEWGEAIEMIEELINTGNQGDCHDAKDMADSINNMMPECQFDDDVDEPKQQDRDRK